jgi:hypothetical protein
MINNHFLQNCIVICFEKYVMFVWVFLSLFLLLFHSFSNPVFYLALLSGRSFVQSRRIFISGHPRFRQTATTFFREIFFQFLSYFRCCHLSAETVSFRVQRLQNQSEVKFSFSFQNGSNQNDSNKNGLFLIAPLCIHFPADLRRYEIFSIYRFFSYNNFFNFPFNL